MDLRTGRETTRFGKIDVLPVTDLIIKRVEAMAAKQGIKSLKIQNRTKSAFYPADWIAGVDYEDANIQDDEESDDEDDVVPALAERPVHLMDSDYEETGQELENDHTLNESECDIIDQDEIDDLLAENTTNPTDSETVVETVEEEAEAATPAPRPKTPRPSRIPKPIHRFTYKTMNHNQVESKNVDFNDEQVKLEKAHNLFYQTAPERRQMLNVTLSSPK